MKRSPRVGRRKPLKLTITRSRKPQRVRFHLNLGENDRHYDLNIETGEDCADIDHAHDGTLQPGCCVVLGGLNNDDDQPDMEIEVFRSFDASECIAIARTFNRVATELLRVEDRRRRSRRKASGRGQQ